MKTCRNLRCQNRLQLRFSLRLQEEYADFPDPASTLLEGRSKNAYRRDLHP